MQELAGDEFQKITRSGEVDEAQEKKIAKFYKGTGNAEIFVQRIGLIKLDLRAVRNDRGHGNQPERLAAFVAVPEVLKKGRLIDVSPMRDEPKGKFYLIAAPISIAGKAYIAVIQIKAPPPARGIIRVWVHQVLPREQLRQPLQSRATTAAGAEGQSSVQRGAGAAETLLRRIYSVKAEGHQE